MQPSLKEQMHGAEKDPVQVPPFDHKACILCDHVIVQKILGNKCGQSGSLCCNMKECPIEARKRRDAVPVPIVKEEIPCCENCTNKDNDWCEKLGRVMLWHERSLIADVGCLANSGARAYLNKDVIAELERLKVRSKSYDEYQDGVNTGYEMGCNKALALLKGDDK
jgi:hypothetical protein